LIEETPHGRVLKEDELGFTDHDFLMPIADMIGIICPFLRSLRLHDIYGFRRFLDSHDCSLRLEDHAVASLQDRAARKRNAEL
jgi:hypothetical protein